MHTQRIKAVYRQLHIDIYTDSLYAEPESETSTKNVPSSD